jgi:RHS repeat-associated protein
VYDAMGQMVAEYSNEDLQAGTSYLTTDHLGSTRAVTDGSGNVKERHDFLPFGEELFAGIGGRSSTYGYGPDTVHQKFTSKERDIETGLDYMINRYYSSQQGRFTSVDPYDVILDRQSISNIKEANAVFHQYAGNPQHWNKYAYVLNNPLKYIDPYGLAERITVNLNIVYDKDEYTEEEVKWMLAKQIADAKKVYGALDIDFKVTYTAGSANADKTAITAGRQDGAINVFFSQSTNDFHPSGHTNSANGDIFITAGANPNNKMSDGLMSHEIGHRLGLSYHSGVRIPFTSVDIGNIYSDFLIDTSNSSLRKGGVKEGLHWVDDYRTATETYYWPSRAMMTPLTRPRTPTTYDIYRVGARKLAGK